MSRNTFRMFSALPVYFRAGMRTRILVTLLGIAFVGSVLPACGSSTTAVKSTPSPTPTHILTLVPSPTFTPTPKPSPTHVATSQPTQAQVPPPTSTPVQGAPAVLDVRPTSMSIVGHLDCQKNGTYVCFARVLSRSSNQSNLHWMAFTNVPGAIAFSPASGVLAPGQSVLITITVPLTACTPGLFFFRGPVNTHTISWAC